MDAQQFLAEFNHIASAPGGLQRLRELILQLAVSGQLVQPSPTEESVDAALIEAKRLKMEYETSLELRYSQPQPPLLENEYPYTIPEHWRWQRLEQIARYIQRGKGPNYAQTGSTFVVSQKCIRWKGFDLSSARHVEEASLKDYGKERFLHAGDLLWNSTGTGTVGRIAIFNEKETVRAVADSHVTVIRLSNFDSRYVWCVIAAPWVQARIAPEHENAIVSGTTKQVELATSSVRALAIPCPPIPEQKRIIAKVDELMALCSKLEAQQQEREGLCKLTRKAALDSLATAQNSASLVTGWNRVRNGIGIWLDDEVATDELRNAVGFLGCRGLLTESAPIDALESNETIFPLPAGWEWTTLRKLADYITSGSRGWRQFMASHGDIFIRSQDIKYDALVFEDPAFVSLPDKVEGKRTLVRPGDLLVTITGANVGKCAKVPTLPRKAYVSQHIALVRVSDVRHTPFLHWWITNAYGGRKHLARFIYGDKPGLNLPQVGSIPIPLPPQDAQDRIVKALGYYMTICDRLGVQIKDGRNLAGVLAITSVASITGIRIEDKEKMKAPKTELVSNLRIGVEPAVRQQAPLAAILVRHQGELSAKALWGSSGLEIDAFYQQLKTEMAQGWIVQPEAAYMKELETA